MTCLTISNKYIAIAKGLDIYLYDNSNHKTIQIPSSSKPLDNDYVSDIIISSDEKYIAAITSSSKQIILYDLPLSGNSKNFILPRSASRIRFTPNNSHILVADKSGDALIYEIGKEDNGTKLLGHLSLLLDILQTNNEKFIITSDRDEKIRVTCFPNTYNIQTFCLGHKEFVNHVELLSHDDRYLTSTSGDGTLKVWKYTDGALCYSIDTFLDVNDADLKDNFVKIMEEDGIEVNTLPIVHYTITKLTATSSIIAITVHTFKTLLIYKLTTTNNLFSHKLEHKLNVDQYPTAIKLHNSSLYIYNDSNRTVQVYKIIPLNDSITLEHSKLIKFFENSVNEFINKENCFESIKLLYKRKFDNVQEYQERKRQRLKKSEQ